MYYRLCGIRDKLLFLAILLAVKSKVKFLADLISDEVLLSVYTNVSKEKRKGLECLSKTSVPFIRVLVQDMITSQRSLF